ncbi:hypothetical protein HY338_03735 [Candidatus Gottesmanbacteria bacterium]|nr:hypothetical protein [Candidatus Gottesmanbacteria bacterium]
MDATSTITQKHARDFLELAGSITKKPFNISKMTNQAKKYVSREYIQNRKLLSK